MKIAAYCLLAIVAIACSGPKLITPTQTQVDAVSGKYPGVTLAQLELGKASYEGNCQTCHKLYKPGSLDEAGWNEIVPVMAAKANKKAGSEVVNAEKQEAILRYLMAARTGN
ncbi:MAG: hypothetical protein JNM00_06470 [Flavobacteriales bacterium]|nr:hypothetical protein [Flavobacteriales bacterium]